MGIWGPGGAGRALPRAWDGGWGVGWGGQGEKPGRGLDCYRGCHSNRVTWRPRPTPGAGGGVSPRSEAASGGRGFRRGLLPSGQPHGRPSLFRCSPSPLFFIDGETEAQRAEAGRARRTQRRRQGAGAEPGAGPASRPLGGAALRPGCCRCLSPGGPSWGALAPGGRGRGRGSPAVAARADDVSRGAPSDRSRQGRCALMTSRGGALSDGGHQGAASRAVAWTRPPPRTASPRKCPSTGRRTTSSR